MFENKGIRASCDVMNLENKLSEEAKIKNMLVLFNGCYMNLIGCLKDENSVVLTLCRDRNFCETAGLNYNDIQEEDSKLIKIAVKKYINK